MGPPTYSMSFKETLEFLFLHNHENQLVHLSLHQLRDSYDMFLFFVDCLCKGLIMLYGKDGRLILDQLSLHDFDYVKKKLGNAGILVNIETSVNDTLELRQPYIIKPESNYELRDLKLIVLTRQFKHFISFDLRRVSI